MIWKSNSVSFTNMVRNSNEEYMILGTEENLLLPSGFSNSEKYQPERVEYSPETLLKGPQLVAPLDNEHSQ